MSVPPPDPSAPPTPAAPRPRAALYVGLAATTLAGLVLAVHFLATWLYLTPMNPVKVALWGELHAYMHPLFGQNWQLFAPNPVADNQVLLVRARLRDPATGEVAPSPWVDVTSPVMAQIHRQRIGPMSKLARPFSGISQTVAHVDPVSRSIRKRTVEQVMVAYERTLSPEQVRRLRSTDTTMSHEIPEHLHAALDTANRLSEDELSQRRLGFHMLYRVASAYTKHMFEPRYQVVEVNARYDRREFPRFSRRRDPDAKAKVTVGEPFGWHPVYADITLP